MNRLFKSFVHNAFKKIHKTPRSFNRSAAFLSTVTSFAVMHSTASNPADFEEGKQSRHVSRANGMFTKQRRTVLFAFDDTYGSEFALKWAIANFFKPDDKVVMINVVQDTENDPITFKYTSFLDFF